MKRTQKVKKLHQQRALRQYRRRVARARNRKINMTLDRLSSLMSSSDPKLAKIGKQALHDKLVKAYADNYRHHTKKTKLKRVNE